MDLTSIAKRIAFASGLARTRYSLLIDPATVFELLSALRRGEHLDGDVIEVGVARGKTTVFLNRFMDSLNSTKRYIALDTFGGFTQSDVDYERQHRHKPYSYRGEFTYNSVARWRRTVLAANGIGRADIIQGDIKNVQLPEEMRFSTALIDVDLYLPTLAALRKIYARLVPGGTIVVDDVLNQSKYDGAYEAFMTMVGEARTSASWSVVPPN